MAPPVGYSNAVVSKGGRWIAVAGQTAMGKDGKVLHPGDLVEQADVAFRNVATVLRAAGGATEHLVRMRIYVLDADRYAAEAKDIGRRWRTHFGTWFPAMTLVQVARLYDPAALIEVEADAVVPA
jgi:enamine deaminase RidA (YjgF/YER057c/UK114 family)